ncbi:MAG: hypothetical protein QF719_03290 [Chloroflexota bacterium]|nr:hypothetical protein [Chloroflexota bacterium]MDP6509498.1 hypothetical protein [Chloroflexota bacterium]MDP6757224.1 hypothetical protein [Chloroflexota bacterium]
MKEYYSTFPLIAGMLMFVTGVINYLDAFAGAGLGLWRSLGTGYGMAIIVKLVLVETLQVMAVLLGRSESMQADAETWLTILAVLGVIVMVISTVLRRGTLGMTR